MTLVVTNDSLFLAKENFAHWPLPRILALPPREALLPPYLDVEQKDIIDVERIVRNSLFMTSYNYTFNYRIYVGRAIFTVYFYY